MADAGQSDLERVKWACADVAVDDAERCQRQKPRIAVSVERSALVGASRRSGGAGLRGQRRGGANRSAGKNRRLLIAGGFHRSTRGLTLALTPLVTPALGTGIPSLRGRCVQNLARGRRRQRRRKGRIAAQRKQEDRYDRVGDRDRRRDRNPYRFAVHEAEERQHGSGEGEGRGIDEFLVNDEGAYRREHESGQDG